jgi:glycosyltransferase involved in cell wall biosynthesis
MSSVQPGAGGDCIAYLVNQYPKVSHSFIRREILALERRGLKVERLAIRGWDASLADPDDEAERARTRYVLGDGIGAILAAAARVAISRPTGFWRALVLAVRMTAGSDVSWPRHLVYLAEACRALEWLRRSGARHVHAHFGTNSADVAMLVAALGGPTYSFTAHGPEEFDRAPGIHLGEKIRRSAFTIAVSSFGRSQMFRHVDHAHWNKIHVVHCAIGDEFRADPATPVPAAPRLVCIGRLCEQKGQLLLVEAACRLAAESVELELVLAGDGEMREAVEAAIGKCGLRDRVRVTGWLSSAQVREELRAARALVLPSFAEGLPVVIMEAMAMGRPVLSTFVAGIPELVVSGVHGWLFPAGDVEELCSAMRLALACPPSALQAMGDAARERVLARHDADREASKLLERFRGVA